QPLSRLPGLIVEPLHAELLGLVDLFRHDRIVPGAIPDRHQARSDDLDLREQGAAPRREAGAAAWLRISTAHWRSSRARKTCSRRRARRGRPATTTSMPLRLFRSKGSRLW